MAPLTWTPKFTIAPPNAKQCILSYPSPNVVLVTLNRPKDLNCINEAGHFELDDIWEWLDQEPALSVGIITGEGRAFCAGADLKEFSGQQQSSTPLSHRGILPPSGFGGLSRRGGLKPIIAAVNGLAYGGGTEITVNCDIVVASSTAAFCLPEVKRGLVAIAGAPPRLIRTVGRQRAMEMALTGRPVGAKEAESWGLVNHVVEGGNEGVVAKAIEIAKGIADNSPDAVVVTRQGIAMGWEGVGAEEGTRIWQETWYPRLLKGENMKEGVKAFVEKRKPVWKGSKL